MDSIDTLNRCIAIFRKNGQPAIARELAEAREELIHLRFALDESSKAARRLAGHPGRWDDIQMLPVRQTNV